MSLKERGFLKNYYNELNHLNIVVMGRGNLFWCNRNQVSLNYDQSVIYFGLYNMFKPQFFFVVSTFDRLNSDSRGNRSIFPAS